MQIVIAEAKARFAELVRRAEVGEAIELTRYGRPVARIVAADRPTGQPLIGCMEGAFTLSDDIFAGDDAIARMFDGSPGNEGRLLLDTHILLWAVLNDRLLSATQRQAITEGEIYRSAVSVWEIGIRRAIGRLEVPEELMRIAVDAGCIPLPISWAHAEVAAGLPRHHADPFDRLLIAQAQCEGLGLVSPDVKLAAYPGERVR